MAQHPRTSLRPATGSRTATSTSTHGSQTLLQSQADSDAPPPTLRLRAEREENRHIRWSEDVVDNEGMGKKSSKVCCIYHAPGDHDDSGSDDSSSSDGDSDSDEPDLSRAQRAKDAGKNRGGEPRGTGSSKRKEEKADRKPSPNAYERQPNSSKKQHG